MGELASNSNQVSKVLASLIRARMGREFVAPLAVERSDDLLMLVRVQVRELPDLSLGEREHSMR